MMSASMPDKTIWRPLALSPLRWPASQRQIETAVEPYPPALPVKCRQTRHQHDASPGSPVEHHCCHQECPNRGTASRNRTARHAVEPTAVLQFTIAIVDIVYICQIIPHLLGGAPRRTSSFRPSASQYPRHSSCHRCSSTAKPARTPPVRSQ